MNELALFAGAGGGILGGKLLGWRTRCAVEISPYCRSRLLDRQRDGVLEPFPIWDDVQTFDGYPWRGSIDVVTGGFPCQDISAAGKGEGLEGSRSGLWRHMARIIGEVRPQYALVENSPMLTSRGLGTVLGDLASMGYNAKWGVLGAHHARAPHKRDRIWVLAHTKSVSKREPTDEVNPFTTCWKARTEPVCSGEHTSHVANGTQFGRGERRERGSDSSDSWKPKQSLQDVGHAQSLRRRNGSSENNSGGETDQIKTGGSSSLPTGSWWKIEPDVGRVAHGVADGVDRIRAIGNGQVPAVVRLAWEILSKQ